GGVGGGTAGLLRSTIALGVVLLGSSVVLPASPVVRIVLATMGVTTLLLSLWLRAPRPATRTTGAALIADATGLTRTSAEGGTPVVRWDAPFGVVLLASYGRPFGLLAFTTPTQTRYVPARIDARSDADDELFARVAVLADLDLIDGIGHEPALA